MGSALGTTGLSVLATLAFVAAAILSIIADDRLRNIDGFDNNDNLQAAHSNLVVGIILGWVAAGLVFILVLGYLLTSFKLLQNEWLHFIVWALGVAAAIIAIIYLGFAMRKIDNTPNDDGTQGFLLWAMILTGVGLVLLVILGMWRLTHYGTVYPTKAETGANGDMNGNGGTSVLVAGNGAPTAATSQNHPLQQIPAEQPVSTSDF